MSVPDEMVSDLLAVCEAAAHAGANELLAWRGRFQAREKGPADLVTDADLASQAKVREVVAANYPHHLFHGEEKTSVIEVGDDDFVWLVDPLDGTTNYVHGYPCYATSVAVARGGELLAGVILNPLSGECFTAARGQGTRLNGEPISVSAVKTVGEALVSVSLPPRVAADSPDLADFVHVVQVSQAVRRSGSAALNLAFVAAGRLDAFWATKIQPWDVAAGVLLVREAGGVVTGRDGSAFDVWRPHFVAAASNDLHRDLMQVLGPATKLQFGPEKQGLF